MRKLLFLPMFTVLFCAGFCAFGDTVRGGRSIANSMNSSEPTTETTNETEKNTGAVAARVANRNRAKQVNNTTTARVATRTTAARSAKKTATANTGTVAARAARNVAPAKTSGVVAARAATKQKAVNMGTKVTSATENTRIPQECQDAFYGCMDSFCMLDNVSGGRCRCDDRSEELDDVLDKIMKLDAQSKTLAEEGVERLQRGDAADEIEAMAEDAANKVVAGQKKNQKTLSGLEGENKTKKLDLSIFTNNVFDTDDLMSDDTFGGSDLSDKTGTSLRNAATKLCGSNMPEQCKEYGSMLQMIYVQKVKSDCVAYENDLKQQKMNSENLLKTAQKAMRDAAAEQYQNKNKYKTVGECVVPFKQCMLGEDVCGSGFSKCVVNKMVVAGTAKKSHSIKTGTTTIDIDPTTYDAVVGKKDYCDRVLEQCVSVRDKVWDAFLIDVAPELKAAEYSAEDDQRRNCAKNIVNCVKEAASAEGLQEGTDSWSVFTSDTKNVENICKVQFEQCNAYDTNIKTSISNYVQLSLNAIRADRCTTSIRKCLQKEDNCGKDYSQCVGVSNQMLGMMCVDSVAVDCVGTGNLKQYIERVAQGLLLNIDSALANACRKIIDSAMAEACGSTDSCSSKIEGVSDKIIAEHFHYLVCPKNYTKLTECVSSKEEIPNKENKQDWKVVIEEIGDLKIKDGNYIEPFGGVDTSLAGALNKAYSNIINKIGGYTHVKDCIAGRQWQGFDGSDTTANSGTKRTISGFKNLTSGVAGIVIQNLYDAALNQLQTKKEELEDKKTTDATSLSSESSDDSTDEEEESTACKLGACDTCNTVKGLCKCIAITYFQAVHARHASNTDGDLHDKGEVTMLGGAEYNSKGQCHITYRRHADCSWKGEGSGDGGTGWDCSEHNNVRSVVFNLKLEDKDKIKIGIPTSNVCPPDNDHAVSRMLNINKTQICFTKCYENYELKAYADQTNFSNVWGGNLWCKHRDQEANYGNSSYITNAGSGTDTISGVELKHSNYKFYDNIDSVPSN